MNWHYRPAWVQMALRKDIICAEIGTLKATNAHFMLSSLNIKKLYLLDPYFDQSNEFDDSDERPYIVGTKHPEAEQIARRTLKGFGDKIEWIIKTTEEGINFIPDNSLDFCYIDGDHKYESVKLDIKLCFPKVKIGGILGGHDFVSDHQGCVKAVLESFDKNKLFVGNRDWWTVKFGG